MQQQQMQHQESSSFSSSSSSRTVTQSGGSTIMIQGGGGATQMLTSGGAGGAGGVQMQVTGGAGGAQQMRVSGGAGGAASSSSGASSSVVIQGGAQCHERHEGTSFQAPMFIKPLECIHCEIGQTITFEGKVIGTPEPTIVWTKEGASLESATNISIKNAGGVVTLTVAGIVAADDDARFFCHAENIAGSATSSAEIHVARPSREDSASPQPRSLSTSPQSGSVTMIEQGMQQMHQEMLSMQQSSMQQTATATHTEHIQQGAQESGQFADYGIHGYHTVRFVPQGAAPIPQTQTQVPAVVVRQQVAPVAVVPTQAPPPPPPATPKFTRPLAATAAVEGKQVTLQAGVAGALSIQWIKDGRELTASPDFHISYDGSVATLIITCATLEDTGKYELVAHNQAGSQVSVLFISVEPSGDATPKQAAAPKASKEARAPYFEKKIRHCKLIEGYNGWFEVIVNGEPRPKVEWRKNGEPINLNNSRYKTVSDPTSGFYSLTVTCLVPEDRGEYTCALMNPSGQSQCTAWLLPEGDFAEVLNKERSKQVKDLERQKSRDVVNELSSVFTSTTTRSMTQRPQQQPQQQIATGTPIRGPQPDEFVVSEELPEALAKLEAAQKMRHSSGVNVDVEESKEKIIKPSFKKKPEDVEAREGRLVRFDCVVAGNPRPELSWFHNGLQIFDSSRCKILVNESGVHSLLFMQVTQRDSGTVSCIARNKGGEATFSVQLSVLERETIERPRFIERLPATVTVKAGAEILLSTTAEGVPTPMLSWQKDGVVLSDGQGCRINTNGGHTQLVVDAATGNSAGWYQCTAVNVGGTAATRGKVVVDGGEISAKDQQRRQTEQYEEMEERSTIAYMDERMRQIEMLEKRSQKSSVNQTQIGESEFSTDRMKALEALETRHEKRSKHQKHEDSVDEGLHVRKQSQGHPSSRDQEENH